MKLTCSCESVASNGGNGETVGQAGLGVRVRGFAVFDGVGKTGAPFRLHSLDC